MTIQIFKNYGCLAAEKRGIYTYTCPHPTAVCSDKLTVELPKGWAIDGENCYGDPLLISPWGETCLIGEILRGNENPCFYVYDKNGTAHRQELKIINQD